MKTPGWEWIVTWLETWVKGFKKDWFYNTLTILATFIFGIVRGYLVRCMITYISAIFQAKRKAARIKNANRTSQKH